MELTNKLEVKSLSKRFRKEIVLDNISFSVPQASSMMIMGKSGTGKSVLLKCMLGLLPFEDGKVLFEGTTLGGKHKHAFLKKFGMLFQGSALFDSLSVWENITFRQKYFKLEPSKKIRKEIALEKLSQVGLGTNVADLMPSQLSGGMRKRVGIARAISTDPEVIFFDEPTSGLDPVTANLINKLIRKIVSEIGATAITISHDINSIKEISDSVILLDNRKIAWEGNCSDIGSSSNKILDEFFKSSSFRTN